MSNGFKGIWASFEYIDDTASVIEALRKDGMDYSVLSPCPRHELEHAMGEPVSRIPFVTLLFGGMGIFFGYSLPSWTSLDWVLPVSGKPIVSIPPYTVFGFELMVLLGGVSTAVGIFLMGAYESFKTKMPSSEKYKSYNRFTNDRFGVIVRCSESDGKKIEKLMKDHKAEEVVSEF